MGRICFVCALSFTEIENTTTVIRRLESSQWKLQSNHTKPLVCVAANKSRVIPMYPDRRYATISIPNTPTSCTNINTRICMVCDKKKLPAIVYTQYNLRWQRLHVITSKRRSLSFPWSPLVVTTILWEYLSQIFGPRKSNTWELLARSRRAKVHSQ